MGNTGIAIPIYSLVARQMVGGHRHAPAALLARKNLRTCYRGGWVGPGVGLDGYEEKISCSHRGSNPESSNP